MDLSDKIRQILRDKDISPSIFADEIGIQRSSISHILAGRNKPSLDIVQKIVKRFPELGLNWILDDESLPEISSVASSELRKKQETAPQPNKNAIVNRREDTGEKKVERILVFFTDGTYKEFREA